MDKKRRLDDTDDPQKKYTRDEVLESEYFKGYSGLGIHEEMLRDRERTMTYKIAIEKNKHLFENKVVLDLGCGSSILSCFCAMNGASKVYAVDNAKKITEQAKLIIKHNKLDHIIQIIEGKIEEIELPEKVDIIISEWMGYFLLYEFMIESLIYARDKWLKEDGRLFPTKASIYFCPFSDKSLFEERLNFWEETKEMYGIDFSPLIPLAKEDFFKEPQIEFINPSKGISFDKKVLEIDLKRITLLEAQDHKREFEFQIIGDTSMNGLYSFFEVDFNQDSLVNDKQLILSTSPSKPPTHWRQSLFFFDQVINVKQDDKIIGSLSIKRSPNTKRGLHISMDIKIQPSDQQNPTNFQKNFIFD